MNLTKLRSELTRVSIMIFKGIVNWGEESHPLLLSTSTPRASTVEVLATENKAISEEVVNQMLPICYQFRDESLLQMRNNSTIAVGINFLTVLAGTVVGTWVAVPPTQERQEIKSIQPPHDWSGDWRNNWVNFGTNYNLEE